MNFPLLLFPLIYTLTSVMFSSCDVHRLLSECLILISHVFGGFFVVFFLSKQATRFCPFAKNARGKDFFFFISGLCFGENNC